MLVVLAIIIGSVNGNGKTGPAGSVTAATAVATRSRAASAPSTTARPHQAAKKEPAPQTHHAPASTPAAAPAIVPSTHTAAPPPPSPAPAPPAPATSSARGCYPLTNGGNCYEPGEFCRSHDHGVSGVAGDGEAIKCENNDGWRWEPA